MKEVFAGKIDKVYQVKFGLDSQLRGLITRSSKTLWEKLRVWESLKRSSEFQERNVKSLLHSLNTECPESFEELLTSSHKDIQKRFTDGLIIQFWSTKDPNEQLLVLQRLSQMAEWIDEAVLEAIVHQVISSKDARLHGELCFALGSSGNPRFKPVLLSLTESEDEWVKKQAYIALANLELVADDEFAIDLETLWGEFLEEDENRKEVFPPTPEGIEHEACLREVDPFSVEYRKCVDFNSLEKDIFQVRAQFMHSSWIREQLKKINADWIVVVKGKVIGSSTKGELVPLGEDLDEIGKANSGFPFLFFRTALSEESGWSNRADGGYYPTVPLEIEAKTTRRSKRKNRIKPRTDIDTGSYHTLYISLELLSEKFGELPGTPLALSDIPFHGKRFWYRIHVLTIVVKDNRSGKEKKKEFNCLGILKWKDSTFTLLSPKREAFAGTEFIMSFPLALTLDGRKKKPKTLLET